MAFPIEIAIVVLVVLVTIAVSYFASSRNVKFVTVKVGNAAVRAEVADNAFKKMRGLMFRKSLGENDGMIFPFDSEDYYGFWMMNTSIPLDLIWINAGKQVVYIQNDAQPCTIASCPVYKPDAPAKYVLEVNAGFSKDHNIKVGTKAQFEIK